MIITVTPNPVLDRTLTVPDIEFYAVLRASDVRLDWGGKGFNVSRTLQVLGAESLAMGFVGGATGDMLEQGLHGLGIETDFVRIAGETRTNIVITERQPTVARRNGPPHQGQRGRADPFGRRAAGLLPARHASASEPGDICVMAGSLPPGCPADFYAQLCALLRDIGARAVLDASGEALRHGCAARPFLAKPNGSEVSELLGVQVETQADAVDAAQALLKQGVEMAVISLGAGGLVLAHEDGIVVATPPAIQERNAVGAGDALAAGLVWALDQGFDPVDVARWGVATGTASAAVDGVASGTRARDRSDPRRGTDFDLLNRLIQAL